VKVVLAVAAAATIGLASGALVGRTLQKPPPPPPPPPPSPLAALDPDEAPLVFDIPRFVPPPPPPPPKRPPPAPPAPPAAPPRPEPVECRALAVDFQPAHFAATPDGRYLLLANRDTDKVVVWDWDKDEEERRISVEGGPCYILVKNGKAFVANGKVSTLSEIDLDTFTVVNSIQLPTGQPYYMSSAADPKAPIFVTCGQYTARKVVRVDVATEKATIIQNEVYMSVLTIHTSGKTAVKQGEFGHSPSGSPNVYEVNKSWELARGLGYLHESFGLLHPDSKGKYWLGAGGVWDASLSKQVAKLENARHVVEHPTDPVMIAIGTGDTPWSNTNQGTVTLYSTSRFTNRYSRPFTLPAAKNNNYNAGDLSVPVVFAGSYGTVVIFNSRGNLVRLLIRPEATPSGAASRLSEPLPKIIPGGVPWTFTLALQDSKATASFKGIELPPGCELDRSSGRLSWEDPRPGDYDIAIKVFVTSEDSFLVEEHLTVTDR
jgi:hypothetical protein